MIWDAAPEAMAAEIGLHASEKSFFDVAKVPLGGKLKSELGLHLLGVGMHRYVGIGGEDCSCLTQCDDGLVACAIFASTTASRGCGEWQHDRGSSE